MDTGNYCGYQFEPDEYNSSSGGGGGGDDDDDDEEEEEGDDDRRRQRRNLSSFSITFSIPDGTEAEVDAILYFYDEPTTSVSLLYDLTPEPEARRRLKEVRRL